MFRINPIVISAEGIEVEIDLYELGDDELLEIFDKINEEISKRDMIPPLKLPQDDSPAHDAPNGA